MRDFVLSDAPDLAVRMTNEAGNDEVRRRGEPERVMPSGQLLGHAIVWQPWPGGCGAAWIELGTL